MHLSYMHPVTSENQFHCTRLYAVSGSFCGYTSGVLCVAFEVILPVNIAQSSTVSLEGHPPLDPKLREDQICQELTSSTEAVIVSAKSLSSIVPVKCEYDSSNKWYAEAIGSWRPRDTVFSIPAKTALSKVMTPL